MPETYQNYCDLGDHGEDGYIESVYSENSGDQYGCEECIQRLADSGEIQSNEDGEWEFVSNSSGIINSYGYKPSPVFHFLSKEGKIEKLTPHSLDEVEKIGNETFGFELETDRAEALNINDVARDWQNYQSQKETIETYLKEDGTCTGFEIVSHPFTFDAFKKSDFSGLEMLRERGLRSYHGSSCGIHVHISRKAFTGAWHLFKFQRFFYYSPNFIKWISQRKLSTLQDWANVYGSSYIENDNFVTSDPWTGRDMGVIYDKKIAKGNLGRGAVNTQGHVTVEVRIFRGTLFEPSFRKNVEFCKAVLDFTREEMPGKLSPSGFADHVKKNKKAFPHLFKWLSDRGSFDEVKNPIVNFTAEYEDTRINSEEFKKAWKISRKASNECEKLNGRIYNLQNNENKKETLQGTFLLASWKNEALELREELKKAKKKTKKVYTPKKANAFFIGEQGLEAEEMKALLSRKDLRQETINQNEA